MAMRLGYKTKMLIVGDVKDVRLSNNTYDNLVDISTGKAIGQVAHSQFGSMHQIKEDEYIDLGIITSETEDLTAGGVAVSVPLTNKRINWAVGGRVLRINISGVIPDGVYVADTSNSDDKYATFLNGKSNSAVFRYKINKFFAYTSILTNGSKNNPNTVQYRRYGVNEKDAPGTWSSRYTSEIGSWVVTNYNTSYIEGTRHLKYTLTLDFANDVATSLNFDSLTEGMKPRDEGDL